MNTVPPETICVSTGTGDEKSCVCCASAGLWDAGGGFTLATDCAGAPAVGTFCFASTVWHAMPFTSVSFGAKTFPDVERSRHSILTGTVACCPAKTALAEHPNTRTTMVVFTEPPVSPAWSTASRATTLRWYSCEEGITWPEGQVPVAVAYSAHRPPN